MLRDLCCLDLFGCACCVVYCGVVLFRVRLVVVLFCVCVVASCSLCLA